MACGGPAASAATLATSKSEGPHAAASGPVCHADLAAFLVSWSPPPGTWARDCMVWSRLR